MVEFISEAIWCWALLCWEFLITASVSLRLTRWLWQLRICLQCRRLRISPWVRKIPWRRNGNPLQNSCLENFMNRGAWWATVHEVSESDTTEWLTLWLSVSLLVICLDFLGSLYVSRSLLISFKLSDLLECNF